MRLFALGVRLAGWILGKETEIQICYWLVSGSFGRQGPRLFNNWGTAVARNSASLDCSSDHCTRRVSGLWHLCALHALRNRQANEFLSASASYETKRGCWISCPTFLGKQDQYSSAAQSCGIVHGTWVATMAIKGRNRSRRKADSWIDARFLGDIHMGLF